MPNTTYGWMYAASWIVLLVGLVVDGINVITPEKLGLPVHAGAWAALFALVCRGLQSVLPALQRTPTSRDNSGPASNPDPMPRDR